MMPVAAESSLQSRWPPTFPPAFASAYGDDSGGLWADLTIDTIGQRFRWIEPGTFWMGSPEDEVERRLNEGPRHLVTLSGGFWLADTACTQALWQTVIGTNPSRFQGDTRPVEHVSWHDVQKFLRALSPRVDGVHVTLPREAEWEYACRAGTETPFNVGDTVTPAQVNYGGLLLRAGGAKGEYRKETVPVKSFPPNRWGLYEMHGNVWEWCEDGLRSYESREELDPVGPLDSKQRVGRGGSWFSSAWDVRSAYRNAVGPVGAVFLGFRLCLRSMRGGAGAPPEGRRPGGPTRAPRSALE